MHSLQDFLSDGLGLGCLQGHIVGSREQIDAAGNQVGTAREPAKAAKARVGSLLHLGLLLGGHRRHEASQQSARQLGGGVRPGYER